MLCVINWKKINSNKFIGNQQCNSHLPFPGQHYSFHRFFQTFPHLWSFSRVFKAFKISTLNSRTFHTFPGSVRTLLPKCLCEHIWSLHDLDLGPQNINSSSLSPTAPNCKSGKIPTSGFVRYSTFTNLDGWTDRPKTIASEGIKILILIPIIPQIWQCYLLSPSHSKHFTTNHLNISEQLCWKADRPS